LTLQSSCCCFASASASGEEGQKNPITFMNDGGIPYQIANAPNYNTDSFLSNVEYFDVYSLPIKTLYSEVHWTSHGNVSINLCPFIIV
jgi:hypothetical protein